MIRFRRRIDVVWSKCRLYSWKNWSLVKSEGNLVNPSSFTSTFTLHPLASPSTLHPVRLSTLHLDSISFNYSLDLLLISCKAYVEEDVKFVERNIKSYTFLCEQYVLLLFLFLLHPSSSPIEISEFFCFLNHFLILFLGWMGRRA